MATATRTSSKPKPIVLDPDNEFESVLIAMAERHRDKAAVHGTEDDPLADFYDMSKVAQLSPTRVATIIGSKHEARLMKWLRDGEPADQPMAECFLDRAMLAVIARVLYERGPIEVGWVEPS